MISTVKSFLMNPDAYFGLLRIGRSDIYMTLRCEMYQSKYGPLTNVPLSSKTFYKLYIAYGSVIR